MRKAWDGWSSHPFLSCRILFQEAGKSILQEE
nr:MAG TPA: hypothetical protein [Caudoviricetes sp.]